MCTSPKFIWIEKGPKHVKQTVNCKVCRQCIMNRRNDYVGRCLAEASESSWCWFVTLTYENNEGCEYGRWDGAHEDIDKTHFQKWIKRVRRAGNQVRYIAVAEMGDRKGRVHFHAILFGTGQEPRYDKIGPDQYAPIKFEWNKKQFHWDHGFNFIRRVIPGDKSFAYVIKYIQKEYENTWFTLSKKPALGAVYMRKKAQQLIDLGILPQKLQYMPPGTHKKYKYPISGTTRRDYLKTIIDALPNVDYETVCLKGEDRDWMFKAIEAMKKQTHKIWYDQYIKQRSSDEVEEGFEEYRESLHYPSDRQMLHIVKQQRLEDTERKAQHGQKISPLQTEQEQIRQAEAYRHNPEPDRQRYLAWRRNIISQQQDKQL